MAVKNKDTFAQDLTPEEAAVYESFRGMLDALCAADTDRLAALIADDAHFVDMKGRLISREEYLEDVKDGSINYSRISLRDVRIEVTPADGRYETDADGQVTLNLLNLDEDDADMEAPKKTDGEDDAPDTLERTREEEDDADASESAETEQADADALENGDDDDTAPATATLTCTAHVRARLMGMSGTFNRHLIAFFRKEDGVWRYTGG